MAIEAEGIQFYPLFWVWHDQWRYYYEYTHPTGPNTRVEYDHFGHCHLFLMGFDWADPDRQDAFSGSQDYTFTLTDLWGPRSRDGNQQHQYTLVGTPKWYFHVQELWRRVYVQPWDLKVASAETAAQRGLRYDCSQSGMVAGPYREGRDHTPAFLENARTLPIDYYLDPTQSQVISDTERHRTHWLKDRADALFGGPCAGTNPAYDPNSYDPRKYDLQHGTMLYAGGDLDLPPEPAAAPPFSDNLYIWPLIEYQAVTQLDWARLPGADPGQGDGFSVTVSLPFTDVQTGTYLSPFCARGTSTVDPIGIYHNSLVTDDHKSRYRTVNYDDPASPPDHPYYYDSPAKLPPELSGELITWHNPYGEASGGADGRWVQQCLGGIVQAKCQVTLQHKLGGTETVWVHGTQYLPAAPFAGSDQAPGGG